MSHFGLSQALLMVIMAVASRPRLEVVPPSPLSPETLYRDYSRYVAAIAHRLLGREDDVDDVVQDVFLAAHRGIDQLRDPAAVRGWLASITVRIARRRLRARKMRMMLHLGGESDLTAVASTEASPEVRALVSRVYGLLDRLPADERIAWTLRYLEGEKLDIVAQMCGVSLATAKRRIAAAHEQLERGLR
jgi:RNA polymerase sigma-70 factor, ECF subfamily